MKLPTEMGKRLLMDHFKARMEEPMEAAIAVGDFQRMALVSTLEETMACTMSWFRPESRVISEGGTEWTAINLCYNTVKQDILGLAVEALVSVASAVNAANKDKIMAATMLNELYGEKELVKREVLTDKLVLDLVGKG